MVMVKKEYLEMERSVSVLHPPITSFPTYLFIFQNFLIKKVWYIEYLFIWNFCYFIVSISLIFIGLQKTDQKTWLTICGHPYSL